MKYIEDKKELYDYFGESYYNSINYIGYQNRVEKYNNTALEIIELLNINKTDYVLDYGCATGLLLDGFRKQGLVNIFGFDISKWAVEKSQEKNLNVSFNKNILSKNNYKLTTVLDVFEHMFDDDIEFVLNKLTTDVLLIRIPVKLEGKYDFHLDVSKKDPTHVNCKTKEEWIDKIKNNNFKFKNTINTSTIYDSDGCFCGYFEKI